MTDRAALIAALRDVFRARGWDGASLADLAAATGLSRATLYHHFPNGKADMAAAALADVETRLSQQVLVSLRGPGSPDAKLHRMCKTVDVYYRQGELGCLLGVLTQGRQAHGLGDRVADAFAAWIDALRDVAIDTGLGPRRAADNALAVIISIQGSLVLASAMGSPAPFKTMLERLPDLLFDSGPAGPKS